jgi:CRISPR-associated protein Cst2
MSEHIAIKRIERRIVDVGLIDCPASALNNAGTKMPLEKPDLINENWTAIKKIRTAQGVFPYVSAQAFRYWLRETLKSVPGWTASPVFREDKVAYTDADPITYAEDDIFGYMRAPGGKGAQEIARKQQQWTESGLSGVDVRGTGKEMKFEALTRYSPFKMSTLISIAPLRSRDIGSDFGSMSRFEGDPVLFVHEFYRTTLMGMFSIDLGMMGRFYHVDRTGFRHLDDLRMAKAEEKKLEVVDGKKAYELSQEIRSQRLTQLLQGLATLNGGAKQSIHYTDVAPRFILLGVARGGNHLFGTSVGSDKEGQPVINFSALQEIATVFKSELLSGFFAGLAKGYLDSQRSGLLECLKSVANSALVGSEKDLDGTDSRDVPHPVETIRRFSAELNARKGEWLA